jgi:hypothetical protein
MMVRNSEVRVGHHYGLRIEKARRLGAGFFLSLTGVDNQPNLRSRYVLRGTRRFTRQLTLPGSPLGPACL